MTLKQTLSAGLVSAVMSVWGCAHMSPSPRPLKNEILTQSLSSKVIMFGEIHGRYTRDSNFVIGILPELKKQGYNYLALEMPRYTERIPERESFIKSLVQYVDGEIIKEDIEPDDYYEISVFIAGWMDLIDKARSLDMKIVHYDDDVRDIEFEIDNKREAIASNNLKEQVFDKDPDAKMVVYCGAYHVSEENNSIAGRDITWLAQHLNNLTGNSVFTVSFAKARFSEIKADLSINLGRL